MSEAIPPSTIVVLVIDALPEKIVVVAGGTITVRPEQITGRTFRALHAGDIECARRKFDAHLSGRGREKPETARITDGVNTLPAELADGTFALRLRRQGEKAPAEFTIVVSSAPAVMGTITGKVFNDDDGDGVLDAIEKGSGERRVVLVGQGFDRRAVISAVDGTYAFTGLPGGEYRVGRESFPSGYTASNVDVGPDGLVPVTLPARQTVTINLGTKRKPAKPITPPVTDGDTLPETPGNETEEPPVEAGHIFGVCGMTWLRPTVPVTSAAWRGTRTAAQVFKAIGLEGAREWVNFIGRVEADTARIKWDRIKEYIDAGVPIKKIVVCLAREDWTGVDMPTPESTAASVAAFIATIPEWARHLVEVEVGNEFAYIFDPAFPAEDYWPGTVAEFVTLMLNPAYDVLHAAGYTVILGGLNAQSPNQLKQVQAAGGKFDKIGHHPYSPNVADYTRKTAELIDLAPGKEISETEWNTKDGPGLKTGKTKVAAAVANQRATFAARAKFPQVTATFEFSVEYQTKTMTGPMGWFVLTRDDNKVVVSAKTSAIFELRFAGELKTLAK